MGFDLMRWDLGLFGGGKKKKSTPQFDYQPYSGARPTAPQYVGASEKAIYDTILPRSQGVGVGYDPARRAAQEALIKNELGAQEEDQLRSARGAISSSGLSGNPRAYEALAGRVKRDTGRNLENSLSRISIEDLTRANEERDINTQRLQNFSNFQFGQSNKVADFDLGVYGAEQGNRGEAFDRNEGVRQYEQNRGDEQFSDLSQLALAGADLYLSSNGAPPGTASAAASALGGKSSGTGIAPQTPSFYNQPLNYKNRRLLTR